MSRLARGMVSRQDWITVVRPAYPRVLSLERTTAPEWQSRGTLYERYTQKTEQHLKDCTDERCKIGCTSTGGHCKNDTPKRPNSTQKTEQKEMRRACKIL